MLLCSEHLQGLTMNCTISNTFCMCQGPALNCCILLYILISLVCLQQVGTMSAVATATTLFFLFFVCVCGHPWLVLFVSPCFWATRFHILCWSQICRIQQLENGALVWGEIVRDWIKKKNLWVVEGENVVLLFSTLFWSLWTSLLVRPQVLTLSFAKLYHGPVKVVIHCDMQLLAK